MAGVRHLARLGVLAGALLAPGTAAALTLDWTSNPWPGTSVRTASYAVGSGDVVVTVTDSADVIVGSGGGFLDGFSPGSLSTNAFLDPPSNAGADSLFVKTDENTALNTGGQFVSIDILFTAAQGVRDVSFSVLDVDNGPLVTFFGIPLSGFTDELEVTASNGSSSFDPSSVGAASGMPSWSFDGLHTVTGTAGAGSNSDDGTVSFTFDQVIRSLHLEYKNTLDQGQTQWIGFATLSFTEAPEPSSGLLVAFGILLLAAGRRHARR